LELFSSSAWSASLITISFFGMKTWNLKIMAQKTVGKSVKVAVHSSVSSEAS